MNFGVLTSSINYQNPSLGLANLDQLKQIAFDNMVAAEVDYGHSAIQTTSGEGGAYSNTSLTTLSTINGEVRGLKALGLNKPSPGNLLYAGTTSWTPANAQITWKDLFGTMYPTLGSAGTLDKWVRFRNGPINTCYLESNPGSFSAKNRPIDLIYSFTYMPEVIDEGFSGIKILGPLGQERFSAIDGYSPDITLSNSNPSIYSYKPYVDNWVRLYIDASGVWKLWINVVPDAGETNYTATGTGVTWTTTEWWWGTNSHVLTANMRYMFAKFGKFSTSALNIISGNSKYIWPWDKPSYPMLTEVHYNGASVFDTSAKTFDPERGKTPVFTGGNGIAGNHEYMWYFYDSNDVAGLFPNGGDVLAMYRQVPGAVSISSMASGNSLTQITVDGFNLMSGSVSFTTDVATTANAIVSNINANQTKYLAQHRASGMILLHPQGVNCNLYSAGVVVPTGSGFTPTKIDYPRVKAMPRNPFIVSGQIFNGHVADGTIYLRRTITPIDSVGNRGETLSSGIIRDNIA